MRLSALLLVFSAIAAGALLVAGGGRSSQPVQRGAAAERWRGLVGSPRAAVAIGQRVLVVLKAPSLSQRVEAAGGLATDIQERGWTAAAFAAQQQFLTKFAQKGVRIKPEFRYTRVLNGFSAALDPGAVALLERAPEVRGVYPVRAAYPADESRQRLPGDFVKLGLGHRPQVSLAGFDGAGVTIALLDTGVDATAPYLHGHVLDGVDVVDGGPSAKPGANPRNASELERHGTEMAGILVGDGGPAGLSGVASGATVLPIRVAGWQRTASGRFAVYARTDQIVAGLERSVDPNADGDAHDAVRLALVPLVEPFAAFADDPLARAALGAARLDTLVIAAAGNDGPAGPAFGDVSGPAGAPGVLAVGAADLRPRAPAVEVLIHHGLHVLLHRTAPLAGTFGPANPLDLALVVPPGGNVFDAHGFSLVAGKAALLPLGGSPAAQVAAAAAAGAAAVLLSGESIPAGALRLDTQVRIPVIGISPEVAAAMRNAGSVEVVIGRKQLGPNPGAGRLAGFSSWGFGFDGRPKPELVAGGVSVTTTDPGVARGGGSLFTSVNGSSASASTLAGAAALLLQARPSLDAAATRSVLVGSARALRGEAFIGQGAGLLDLGSAAAAEVATDPVTLTFGHAGGDGWTGTRTLVVRNVSTRPLIVYADSNQPRHRRVALSISPTRLEIAPGGQASVVVSAHLLPFRHGLAAGGLLLLTPVGGAPIRVPWSILLGKHQSLLGAVRLSASTFKPSQTHPAILAVEAGRLSRSSRGEAIEPLQRLDLFLSSQDKPLGLLARLRDVLPGHFAFGLTGHDPNGGPLRPGRYTLTIVAYSTFGGAASRKSVEFEIK